MDVPSAATAVALTLELLTGSALAQAQPAERIYRIGVLDTGSPTASVGRVESFRKGLRDLGLIEGQSLHIEWRFADGKELAVAPLAGELIGLKPEVIVALGGAGFGELRRGTGDIPIVMAGAHSREAGSTAEALAQSQENFTGIVSTTRALDEKRMELLREAAPAVSRVTILQDAVRFPYRPGETLMRSERWGFTFVAIPVRDPDEFERAMSTASKEGARALSVLDTPMFYTHRRRLADVALRNRLVWISPDREYAEAGALISYGPSGKDLAYQAATYVIRILKGVKPWNLTVEQSSKNELVINLRTARTLRLAIPPSMLARADELIQ